MDPIIFATLIGLLCNYRQEKGAREALTHQTFIEWLEYHRHEEVKNLIIGQAALRTEVDKLLRSDMAEMLRRMDEISKILLSILGRLDEFKGLARAVSSPQSELSDQAVSILYQFAKSGGDPLYWHDFGGGSWTLQAWHCGERGAINVTEPRYIQDDLKQLIAYGFLDYEVNGQGGWMCSLTRSGSRFLQAVGEKVKVPIPDVPE